jgi:hypothetical protein
MIDIADCRDITSLQTVVVLNMFLQCTGKSSQTYPYLGVTVTLALRMGLHRSIPADADDIEAETRRRLFWAIWNMDTRVSSMLGLPRLIGEDDIDQDMSPEVEQGNLFATGIAEMLDGKTSLVAAANAYSKLTQIMANMVKNVYPVKGAKGGTGRPGKYLVSYTKMRQVESALEEWKDEHSYWLMNNSSTQSTMRYALLIKIRVNVE